MTTQNQSVQVATKISTTNDTNGNPRRLWIINEIVVDGIHAPHSNRVGIVEEGYRGNGALYEAFPNAITAEQINVSPSEYKQYIKEKRELDRIKALSDEEFLKELGV